ncbi:MAG: prepilin-type N-terminal cleavage/methylation domain-containing protein [Hyphomicrobiaceae bacterium]|nr:prepilin-type N-terminal cleavage/methylation domain-containing protein [Hyphomicrobiaceae bacterium]
MRYASTGSRGACGSTGRREACERRCAGFSLLEVLAALVILTLAMTVLFRAYSNAMRAPGHGESRLAAFQLGQSVLEQYLGARALKAGLVRGRSAPYQWVLDISPADEELAPEGGSRPWRLLSLRLTVAWPPAQSIELHTLHLARIE